LTSASGERLNKNVIGDLGEKIAARFVQSQGGKVIFRNYRGPKGGELDIVARDKDTLCFIEVKTRTEKSEIRRPIDAVNIKKRHYIVRGGKSWLKLLKDPNVIWRYDVIEVILQQGEKPMVNWVKEAFTEQSIEPRSYVTGFSRT